MPILKSSKKQMRQSLVKRLRNYRSRDVLKISLKNVLTAVKEGNPDEAQNTLSRAYRAIDMSVKKHLIHKNNANHKKSNLSKLVTGMGVKAEGAATVVKKPKKAAPAKAKAVKKTAKKTK